MSVEKLSAELDAMMPSPRQPMLVAEHIVRDHYMHEGVLTLRWWRGNFLQWTGSRWAEIEHKNVQASLYKLLKSATFLDDKKKEPSIEPWAPNRYKIADVTDALAAIGHTEQHAKTPSWLEHRPGDPPAGELVAVGNGLLHVPTRTMYPHTPRLFNTVAVPFPYEPDAGEPVRWLSFLNDLWPDDPDAIATLLNPRSGGRSGRQCD